MIGNWVSIVWVLGALILAVSALRAHQLNARKALVYVLGWAAIFAISGFVFSEVGG